MAAAPRAIPVYFSLGARKGIRVVVLPGHGTVDLRAATVKTAQRLWEEGSPYFRITAEGAKKCYGDWPADALRDLMSMCRSEVEVQAILKLKKSNKALQAAGADRIRELESSS